MGISALLSQLLVAYTVEFDNEFERRMGDAGYPGARLSLVAWARVMRFLAAGPVAVRDLPAEPKLELGCLERWGFLVLQPGKRDGWGSGRGIRVDWPVRLSAKGKTACKIWPPLFAEIEARWEKRFGEAKVAGLRASLEGLHGGSDKLPLPGLLAGLLKAYRQEFDGESAAPLALCANTLRVLGEKPIRLSEIPLLTGGSPETTDIGWQLKPFVVVEPDPSASRGKVVRLSPRGIEAQVEYRRLTGEIEARWEAKFGQEKVDGLRESLRGFLEDPRLAEGLVAPPGTVRAGDQAPALGRRDVGPAARQRMRDLVAQTKAFVEDPAETLPHYPLWDMNRGFGP